MEKTLKEIFADGQKWDENILQAFENNKLVFFIGAGVSRIMGIPGWDDFSKTLIKVAFHTYQEQAEIINSITDSKERITVAYNKFKQDDNLKGFYDAFGQAMKPNKDVFDKKENIYEILNRFNALFLTTNADNLFEEVLGEELCHEDCNIDVLKKEDIRLQNHLFYLHGHYSDDIDINNNNLVFTAPQYVNRYNDKNFIGFLEALFKKDNTIVFVGYSLNEFELIDYIVTKAGLKIPREKSIFVLYGFNQNQDITYNAKKDYFKSLGIELIPYDLSEKGYDALIDTLSELNEEYHKNAIIQDTDTISNYIKEYTETHYLYISRILNDNELAKTREVQIVQEIQKLSTFEWTKRFYDEGFFSVEKLNEKIDNRTWPLLELFVDWVKSDDKEPQQAAVNFLDQLTPEQIETLSHTHTYINSLITKMVLALNKQHIDANHLELIYKIEKTHSFFIREICIYSSLEKLVTWDTKYIQKLFDLIFCDTDINSYHNDNEYFIKEFFKKLNPLIVEEDLARFIFRYFTNTIIQASEKSYNIFVRIKDIDNIYKNNIDLWSIALDEIKLSFELLNQKEQRELIEKLFAEKREFSYKLGLYLARKYNYNVSNLILNKDIISFLSCFHEYYLLLKQHISNNYISDENNNSLCELFSKSSFGIEKYNQKDNKEYFEKVKKEKRLLLLQLLKNDDYKSIREDLIKEGITPYESEKIADECDYTRVYTWENETKITREMFNDVPLKQWSEKFVKICENVTDGYSKSDCGRQFAAIILDQNQKDIDIIMPTIKSITPSLLNGILYEFRSKKENFASYVSLIDVCLDMLDELLKHNPLNKDLAKTIFSLIVSVNVQDETLVLKILKHIKPWLKVSIDDDKHPLETEQILIELINRGDFDKFSVLLNCYVTLKKLTGKTLTFKEISDFLDVLENDNANNSFKYTLCYYYQNLKYIAEKESNKISDVLLDEKTLDMTSLMFCVVNSNYIYEELIDKIKAMYISGKLSIPDECKDGIMSQQFYSYIIAARYHEKITQTDIESAFEDENFLQYYIKNLYNWLSKENTQPEEWIIPCWTYIKSCFGKETQQKHAKTLLETVDDIANPSEKVLDVYIELAQICKEKGEPLYLYIKAQKLLYYFDINFDKAHEFIKLIIDIGYYISDEDLKILVEKYRDCDKKRKGKEMLNALTKKGTINNKTKEQLAKLLD